MAVPGVIKSSYRRANFALREARVISDFSSAWLNGFAREYLHTPYRSASALRLVGGAQATARLKPQSLFDNPVFERVKRNDHQPPALFERVNRVGDELIQPLQFAVYRYAKRLESFVAG